MPEQPLSWARERPIERRQPPEEARFNTGFSAVPTTDTRCQLTPPRPRPAAEPYQTSRRPQSNYYQASRRASEHYSRTPRDATPINSRRNKFGEISHTTRPVVSITGWSTQKSSPKVKLPVYPRKTQSAPNSAQSSPDSITLLDGVREENGPSLEEDLLKKREPEKARRVLAEYDIYVHFFLGPSPRIQTTA
ncbi:hypothetical protein HPB50_027874 [Hyalomma asiaticum]|nr:hypothetical protein HPB50_027874 [Hyalomma asiaticum]